MKRFLAPIILAVIILAVLIFKGNLDLLSTPLRHSILADYGSYLQSRLHIPGTPTVTYATDGGYGFNSLTPLLPLWTIMRNIAYIIFAILFIIAGIMIMFRLKIDPKTTASLQNALPKMVLALILVTFSYAIAGFLVDLMWGLTILVASVLPPIQVTVGSSTFDPTNLSLLDFEKLGEAISGFGAIAVARMFAHLPTWPSDLWGQIAWLISLVVQGAVGTIIGIIAGAIIYLAVLWALFKTFFALIGAATNIILAIIFSPIILMTEALPGRSAFGSWIKQLITPLLTFPFITVLVYLSCYFGSRAANFSSNSISFPLIGGDADSLMGLIGVGIFLTIPKAVDILQEFLKNPPFKYGSAWSEATKAGTTIPSAGGKIAAGNVLSRAELAHVPLAGALNRMGQGKKWW